MWRRLGIVLAVALGTSACDVTTKRWAIQATASGARTIIPGALELVHWENPSAAFNLLSGVPSPTRAILLSGVKIVLIVGMLVIGIRARLSWAQRLSLGLLVGGALGNLVDRLLRGTVTDFLYFHHGELHWPAFNVADIAISLGVAILALSIWFPKSFGGRVAADGS